MERRRREYICESPVLLEQAWRRTQASNQTVKQAESSGYPAACDAARGPSVSGHQVQAQKIRAGF